MRFVARIAAPFAAITCVLGCGPGPTDPGPQVGSGPADAGPPPLPVVTLPGTTQQAAEPGLCTGWSSTVLDLSSLAGLQPSAFIHGVQGGFSIVTVSGRPSRIAALAFDAAGSPRAPEVDLPLESAIPSDIIATSEGGWLAAWSSGSSDLPCYGDFDLVHYDVNGTPTGQTPLQAGTVAALGADPSGPTDVAWCNSDPTWSSAMGNVSLLPFDMSWSQSFAPGLQESWFTWRLGTLLAIACAEPGACYGADDAMLQTWNHDGQPALTAVIPDAVYYALTTGDASVSPGADPSTAIIAQADGVSFVSASQILVVPSDVLLNGASPWPAATVGGAQRAVVGFDGHAVEDGGSSDTLAIVEVSSSGARSAIGEAALPASTTRNLGISTVTLGATVAQDAYMVVIVGPTVEAAVFTCTGRVS